MTHGGDQAGATGFGNGLRERAPGTGTRNGLVWLAGAGRRMAMVKGLMVEKIEGHINSGNAEVRVCMSLVWIVDVCK